MITLGQKHPDIFNEEHKVFFSKDAIINVISDEQLLASRGTIGRAMSKFYKDLKCRKMQSEQEAEQFRIE